MALRLSDYKVYDIILSLFDYRVALSLNRSLDPPLLITVELSSIIKPNLQIILGIMYLLSLCCHRTNTYVCIGK